MLESCVNSVLEPVVEYGALPGFWAALWAVFTAIVEFHRPEPLVREMPGINAAGRFEAARDNLPSCPPACTTQARRKGRGTPPPL